VSRENQDGEVSNSLQAITVQHVNFAYHHNDLVLENISFEVQCGQSLCILGINGVGKTTLLNLIVGLLKPKSGRAIINQTVAHSYRDVFLLTDMSNLSEDMSVRDNIAFKIMLMNRHHTSHNDTLPNMGSLEEEPLIKAFELESQLDKKVSTLSSGMRKRVGIVTGMLFNPRIIMLDEPTNSIDPFTRQLLIEYMNELHKAGRTLLTVTHDLEFCWKTATRVIILNNRQIIRDMMLGEYESFEDFSYAAGLTSQAIHKDFGITTT
jgi:ABC-type multidrug transport system ATPase subunit